MSAKLEIVPTPETEEYSVPEFAGFTAERVLRLESSGCGIPDLEILSQTNRRLVANLVRALARRDFKNELPISEISFNYRRNLHECQRLQKSVRKIVSRKRLDLENPGDLELLRSASQLLALELKKAEWLEKEFYPVVFRKALVTAVGEVNQFLIRQNNLRRLDSFGGTIGAVSFMDELHYLLAENPPDSIGCMHYDAIDIRVPETYTDRDEWTVYNILVHELLHYVSYREVGRCGIHHDHEQPDFRELNEAITETLAFTIANRHLGENKTPLIDERRWPNRLYLRAYSQYTLVVKRIFSEVPLEFFADAMLNRDGMGQLRQRFTQAFGDEQSLVKYGKRLRNLYKPRKKRGRLSLVQ